jgi:hypothetical protein
MNNIFVFTTIFLLVQQLMALPGIYPQLPGSQTMTGGLRGIETIALLRIPDGCSIARLTSII